MWTTAGHPDLSAHLKQHHANLVDQSHAFKNLQSVLLGSIQLLHITWDENRSMKDKQWTCSSLSRGRSLTGEVPQVANKQWVWPCEGDGLGLFHRAHGKFCVCCKHSGSSRFSFKTVQIPKWRLTGKVRRVEDVIVEVLLHQNARHPLALNTLIISQGTHHLRGDEPFGSNTHKTT